MYLHLGIPIILYLFDSSIIVKLVIKGVLFGHSFNKHWYFTMWRPLHINVPNRFVRSPSSSSIHNVISHQGKRVFLLNKKKIELIELKRMNVNELWGSLSLSLDYDKQPYKLSYIHWIIYMVQTSSLSLSLHF